MIRTRAAFALLTGWLALLMAPAAMAQSTCSIGSVALGSQTYTGSAISATGTVNYTCTRTSNGSDGSPTTFNVTAGGGSSYGSGTRNAANGAQLLAYSLSTAAAWGDGVLAGLGNGNIVTVTYAGPSTTASGSFNFTFTVPAGQNPLSGRIYSDIVAIGGTCSNKKPTACTVSGGALAISVSVPTICSLSSPPATLNLAYTSFQTGPAAGNTPFGLTCSNGGPYRMSVSPTGGSAAGINYTLKLGTTPGSAADISSTTAYNLTGTGSASTYYVNASAASGQAGTCTALPCSQSGPSHTLLIEY